MRVIVPLQGIVQGRGGLILGSLIPCALFYFLQFYLKRKRSSPPPHSPSASSANLPELAGIPRSSSRSTLSTRVSIRPVPVSSRATDIVRSSDSAYYKGLKKCSEDPYHPTSNPDGIIQLGLAENQLSLDLIGDWLAANLQKSLLGEKRGDLSISGLATYEPFDGLMDLKIADSSLFAEALAMKAAISIALKLKIKKLWIESDCLNVINMIVNEDLHHWSTVHIIQKIKTLSKPLIMKWSHIFREGNQVANHLAKRGLKSLDAMAGFMSQIIGGSVSYNPAQIVLTAGATPAIEALSFCLADPGNAFLVPSPYYPGFDRDINLRTGIKLIPVHCRSTNNFSLSITALEREYKQAKKKGIKVCAVLLTNPSNPVGNLIRRETLYDLLNFATEKNLHLISDELYAGSTYGTEEFVSIAELLDTEDFDKSRVHIIYGLSKDLSLPGFRVGVIYSYNKDVITAATKLARFCAISLPTQHLLVSMLSDTKFIGEYMKVNRERLKNMFALLVEGLKQLGIECCKSSGGFYCWADMSKFLKSYNVGGELELWENILNVAKVNVTPGSSCHCIEPGWFRCCFATLTERDIPVVMKRISKVLKDHKAS